LCPGCEQDIQKALEKNTQERLKSISANIIRSPNDSLPFDLAVASEILNVPVPKDQFYANETFEVTINAKQVGEIYDKKNNKLISGKYPSVLGDLMEQADIPCSFYVRKCVPYAKNSQRGVAFITGNCGGKNSDCQMRFNQVVGKVTSKGDMPCQLTANGQCNAVSGKECEQPLREYDRENAKAELTSSSPKLLFAKNLAQISIEQAFHRNNKQKSLDVLRKISSEINLSQKMNKTTRTNQINKSNQQQQRYGDNSKDNQFVSWIPVYKQKIESWICSRCENCPL
jgi:hypothetical protein